MTSAQPEIRHDLYKRLARHNRRIGFLRLAVPALAVLLLAVPVIEVAISMVADALPIAGIRLEADTLVIDSPQFEGRTATGTVYRMRAERAESRVGNLDIADLYGLHVDLAGGAGYTAQIGFTTAQWTMSTERLVSNEDVNVRDSTGAVGLLAGVDVDWPAQIIVSDGPVRFSFSGGNRLDAATMIHDMGAATWRFEGVLLQMIPTPDAGQDRDPFANLENQ